MPGMREDARAQAAAMESQQTEERAEDSEQNHSAHALIRMSRAENNGGSEHACCDAAARPTDELALQVAAKDNLLDETDEQAEQRPCGNFSSVGGRQLR